MAYSSERAAGPEVAVLTATNLKPERLAWLTELHQSLHNNNCQWEHWIAVNDADVYRVPEIVRRCERTRLLDVTALGWIGPGGARTAALLETTADWVTAVDDDDILTEHSLDARLALADANLDWIGGRMADIIDGHVQVPWDQPARAGRYAPGQMLEVYPENGETFPYFGATILMRRTLAVALGGWASCLFDEDIFLHLAVTVAGRGLITDDVVTCYRRHARQVTVSEAYLHQMQERRNKCRQRATALFALLDNRGHARSEARRSSTNLRAASNE